MKRTGQKLISDVKPPSQPAPQIHSRPPRCAGCGEKCPTCGR